MTIFSEIQDFSVQELIRKMLLIEELFDGNVRLTSKKDKGKGFPLQARLRPRGWVVV